MPAELVIPQSSYQDQSTVWLGVIQSNYKLGDVKTLEEYILTAFAGRVYAPTVAMLASA